MDEITLKQAFEKLRVLLRARQFELRGNCDGGPIPMFWFTLLVEGRNVCQVMHPDIEHAYALIVQRVKEYRKRGEL